MASSYWVDWSDASYPRIRPAEDAHERETLQSLKKCRQEIIDHALEIRQHWLGQANKARGTTTANVGRIW